MGNKIEAGGVRPLNFVAQAGGKFRRKPTGYQTPRVCFFGVSKQHLHPAKLHICICRNHEGGGLYCSGLCCIRHVSLEAFHYPLQSFTAIYLQEPHSSATCELLLFRKILVAT
jgi:hypothetical protein